MVAAAVIIHLVTDGTYYGDQKQETISVQLLDTKEQSHDLGKHVLLGLVQPWYHLRPPPPLKRSPPSPFLSPASSLPGVLVVVVYPEKPLLGKYEDADSVAKFDLHQLLLL